MEKGKLSVWASDEFRDVGYPIKVRIIKGLENQKKPYRVDRTKKELRLYIRVNLFDNDSYLRDLVAYFIAEDCNDYQGIIEFKEKWRYTNETSSS